MSRLKTISIGILLIVVSTLFLFNKFVPSSSVLGFLTNSGNNSWSMFHGDPRLTGQSPYDTSHVDGSIKWRFKAGHWIESSPVIGPDNTIYFVDHTCTLYAIDPLGEEKWRFSGGDPVYSKEWQTTSCSQSTPAVASDGTIYFLPMTGNLFAVSKDGQEKWRYPVFAFKNIWSSPTIGSDGTIYVGSEAYPPSETGKPQEKGAHVYALNSDGTLKWSHNTRSVWVTSTPSLGKDGTIYLSGGIQKSPTSPFVNSVYAFNSDGSVKWTFEPPNGVVEGSIALGSDDILYFTVKGDDDPRNAMFYALTPEGGIKWSYPLSEGASSTPAISTDGVIYFGDWGGTFYAFNSAGNLLWKKQTPSGYETLGSSPSIGKEGTIYFGSTAGYFFALTPEGEEKWRLDEEVSDGGVMASPAIGSDGTIYITTLQRELLAIGSKDEIPANEISSNFGYSENENSGFPYTFVIVLVLGVTALVIFRKKLPKPFMYVSILVLLSLSVFLILNTRQSPKDFDPNDFDNNEYSYDRKEDVSIANVCPDRVYGTPEKGYYAVYTIRYDVKQFDLSNEQYEWTRANCTKTIWPEDMAEGYKGNP